MHFETDPAAAWVAALAGRSPRVAAPAVATAAVERRLFRHLEREHRAAGRESYIEIDAPFELYAIARLLRPTHVVEVGVSSGVSSAYLLQALEQNRWGTLHSVDLPKIARRGPAASFSPRASWSLLAARSSGWAVPFALRRRWDLRIGDKAEVVPLLAEELAAVELLVYDVPHEDGSLFTEFRTLDPILSDAAVALVDHGPGGGECEALRRWAGRCGATPVSREGLGLFGARKSPRASPATDRSRSPGASRKRPGKARPRRSRK